MRLFCIASTVAVEVVAVIAKKSALVMCVEMFFEAIWLR